MIHKLTIAELPIQGKKVLMRVDFNVPLDDKGNITDTSRIKASLPSIRYILDNGGSLILMSHLGRPKGKVVSELSLAPVGKKLSELIGRNVIMASDCVGSEVQKIADTLVPGQVVLLENLRFHEAEEKPEKDPEFAKQLAKLGDFYVNDAFGTAHRTHTSVTEVPKLFPNAAAAGFLLEKEIKFLGATLIAPTLPFTAIIGGAKISTKIGVLKALLEKVSSILIGGGMAYTFLKAEGVEIGKSLCEEEFLNEAKDILKLAKEKNVQILLPSDVVITDEISENGNSQVIDIHGGIPSEMMGVDIGPTTIERFIGVIKEASTVLWNGPLGVFEIPPFSKGTFAIAEVVASLKEAVTIVGGGDSIAALHKTGLVDKIDHISTGGGASLEYIEFGTLPGIEALSAVQIPK